MLPESKIDEVIEGVRECYRELTVHGAGVILDDMVTANKPFTPAAPWSSSEPQGASSSASLSSAHQPDVVALRWSASRPWFLYDDPGVFIILSRKKDWSKASDFTFLHVDPKQRVAKATDAGEGMQPTRADLVVWHPTHRILELQTDPRFTTTGVINVLAKELAVDFAKVKLLDFLQHRLTREEGDYTPKGAGDPAVVQFVARFESNLIALVEEASYSSAAFSVSHPLLPHDMKDQLREEAALNRRQKADEEAYSQAFKEYEAAMQAYNAAAATTAGASASHAPAEDMKPEKPVYSTYAGFSPDPFAASPPSVVLRPMEDLYRIFTDAEMMVIYRKVILSRTDCVLCPGYEVWFEKMKTVKNDDGTLRHEYGFKTGEPYC